MHERTRRELSRVLFVFCCALPTLLVVGLIVITWTPWFHNRQIETVRAALANSTACDVEMTDARRGSPTQLKMDGLVIREPESGGEMVRIRQLEVSTRDNEIAVVMQQPEIQSAQLAALWRLFHDRFLRRPDWTERPVRLAANDLTLHSTTHAMTLRDVDVWFEPDGSSLTANVQATLAAAPSATPVLISVTRDRSAADPATIWTLTTGPTPLPLAAIADFHPSVLGSLGPDATIRGTVRWSIAESGWTLDLGGCRLSNIPLDRLVYDSPHRLTGMATIELERCNIDPGKRVDVAGTIIAGGGHVGRSLLSASESYLNFAVVGMTDDRDVRFDLLAMHFQISDTEMRVEGVCQSVAGYEGVPPGIAIIGDNQPIAASSRDLLPAMNLASLVAPPHAVPVPVASQNHALMSLLIPPSRAIPETVPMRGRIRTAGRIEGENPVTQPF